MTRLIPFLAALLGLAEPGMAADPMTAEAFEHYTTGRTLTYATGDGIYGSEEYLPGRRVRWAYEGGDCLEGEWYPAGEMICFAYEDGLDPQCWEFERAAGGLRARFMNEPAQSEIYEIRQSRQPLICPGPRIGV